MYQQATTTEHPPSERRSKILELVKEGNLLSEVIEKTGSTDATVRADLRLLGIDISEVSDKNVRLRKRTNQVLELHRQNKRIADICRELSLTYGQVEYALKRAGVTPIAKDWYINAYMAEVLPLLFAGSNVEMIASEFNLENRQAQKLCDVARTYLRSNFEVIVDHMYEVSEQTVSLEQICHTTGIGRGLLVKAATQAGRSKLWTMRQERRERVQQVITLFNQGVHAAELARQFGVSNQMIRNDLVDAGIDPESFQQEQYRKQVERIVELTNAGKVDKEIAKELGMRLKHLRQLALNEGIELKRELYKFEIHGTVQCYNRGCHCPECVKANTARAKEYKGKIRKGPVPEHIHGTVSGYFNWACRCDRCTKAGSEHNKEATLLPQEVSTHRTNAPWSPEEERTIQDYSKTARQLAIELNRSVGSVNARRSKLNQAR